MCKAIKSIKSMMTDIDNGTVGIVRDAHDDWVYPHHHKNQQYISELMSLVHGRPDDPYPRETTFTKAQLLELQPRDIVKYLYLKAFEDPWPTEDALPISARAGSLRKAKNGISWFMPDKGVAWLDGRGGNPTRHSSVYAAIKRVEKLETKGLGVEANDKRAYSQAEFNKLLEILRSQEDFAHRIKYPTMTLWAAHLIHRLDDTCHFRVTAPHGNQDFPFTLKTKTKWSKNVTTMTQCPDQIILGSSEWKTCTILWLAIYMERWLQKHPQAVFLFTNNNHIMKGPENIKRQYKNRVQRLVWNDEEFKSLLDVTGDDADKGLGTVSCRKFSSTKGSRRGASDQQLEYRGRWVGDKGGKVIRRHYITKDDPFTDAYVGSLLCDGGPIRYDTKPGVVVTDNWLFIECVPHVRARFPDDDRMCRVLGLAILWAVFDGEANDFLEPNVSDRIRTNFTNLHGEVEGGNPVRKVPIMIITVNDRLDIMDRPERGNNGGVAGVAAGVTGGGGNVHVPFNPANGGRVSLDELYGLVQCEWSNRAINN